MLIKENIKLFMFLKLLFLSHRLRMAENSVTDQMEGDPNMDTNLDS